MTLCEEDCTLEEYNKTSEKVKCNCKIKVNIPIIKNVQFDKSKLLQHFTNINKIINIEILKCYKNVLKFKYLLKNYGFLFYSLMLVIYFITLFIFYLKSYSVLKKRSKKIFKFTQFNLNQKEQYLKKSKDNNKSKKSRNKSHNFLKDF